MKKIKCLTGTDVIKMADAELEPTGYLILVKYNDIIFLFLYEKQDEVSMQLQTA